MAFDVGEPRVEGPGHPLPRRDVAVYLEDARKHGLRIERVIETHCHADFVSGHLELAATGATICCGEGAQTDYPIEQLSDGQRLHLGAVRLVIKATPGHTPESISVVVYEHANDAVPYGILTGDALFIGDVGRPDLLSSQGLSSADLARRLYHSLWDKILPLPDQTRVFPAHAAGSACGKNLSTNTVSSIGEQRRTNSALTLRTEAQFIDAVTKDQPPAPPYFSFDARRNRELRPLLDEKTAPPPISFAELAVLRPEGVIVLDTREPADYASKHLRGSINVGLSGRFAEFTGDVLRFDQRIALLCPPDREREAKVRLGRIGFDRVVGFLAEPERALLDHPGEVETSSRLTVGELVEQRREVSDLMVFDVRQPAELALGVIPGAVHVPLTELVRRLGEIDRARPAVVYCASGHRSMIAVSVLRSAGFGDVSDLLGGYTAWAGIPVSS